MSEVGVVEMEKEDASLLEELIGSKAKIRIFEFLLSHPIYEYTTQDICEGTRLQRLSVSKALKDLMRYGIVIPTRKVGRAVFYQIDMDNPIVKAFLKLHLELAKIMVDMEKGENEIIKISESKENLIKIEKV